MYTKREIDKMLNKAVFKKCIVSCVQLDEESIHSYKSSLKKNKGNYSEEPTKKKPKLDTKRKNDTEELPIEINYEESTESSNSSTNNVVNKNPDVNPRKTKSSSANDVFKKNVIFYPRITRSASKLKHGRASTSTKEVPIEIGDKKSTESSNSSASFVLKKNQVIDPWKTMSSSKSENEIASTSTKVVPIKINHEESTESSNSSAKYVFKKNQVIDPRKIKSSSANDVFKKKELVYPRITRSASKPKHGRASTSTKEVPIEIGDKKSTESSNSSASFVLKKNQVIDPWKTMSSSKSENEIASTSTKVVPIKINHEESTESSNSSAKYVFKKNQVIDPRKIKSSSANDVFKKKELVYPRITRSASKPKHGIASTITEEVPIKIDEESTESSNSSASYVFKNNQVIDPRKTMSSSKSENEIASTSTEEVPIEINNEESTESSNSSAKYVFKKNQVIDPRITMSASKPKRGIAVTSTEEVPIIIDDEESTESSNSSAINVFKNNEVVDPRITMSASKPKHGIAVTSTEEVPIIIDDEESTESSNSSAINVFKNNEVVDPRITMSASKPKHGIAVTSTEEVPIIIDDEESTESSNSLNVQAKISVIDPRKMMNDDEYIRYINVFLDKKTYVKTVKSALNKNFKLIEIEKLYNKYYSKFVQDTIMVIANLYIIYATTYIQYVAKLKKSLEDKSEAEKLKETYDAKLFHERQTKILERKVKINLTNVVSLFFESEFEKAFKMFFLSILIVVRVLKQPKFWKGDIFKNLSQFLLNCLKNYELNDSRVFSMLQSNDFRLDCINMMLEIEDSKDNDPGITDRLTLFFVTSVNSQKYFQKIVDAIISESEVDLEILIDEASFQCCVNSMFKDPINPSTDQESIDELPVTNTIQTPNNSDEQHSVIAKSPDGTFQDIPGLNRDKSQTIGITEVELSTVTNQPLTKIYHESRTQEFCSEPYTPKVISTKKCIVGTLNNFIIPSGQVISSSSATQQTRVKSIHSIQNNNTVANRPTAAVHDQQVGPSSQSKKLIITVGTDTQFVNLRIIKCFMNGCNNDVNVMCSICKMVKYCSRVCQKRHWYLEHNFHCDQLLKMRKQRRTSRLNK